MSKIDIDVRAINLPRSYAEAISPSLTNPVLHGFIKDGNAPSGQQENE
ncbi:hypothetical protein [Erwinia sp. HR93]|nr:hypothetical protein [Erwinia sp. HR93]MEA1062694.1 hypothetical protein [Erwinia sp. HR93]